MYILVKVIDGVMSYYVRHPGTRYWCRGRFLGFWTRQKSKATVFYDEPPKDWPTQIHYEKAKNFIMSVLSLTERTHSPEEFFTYDTGAGLHYGREMFNLKVTRWLYDLSAKRDKLTASGEFYYIDLDTGEKHFVHQIKTNLGDYEEYIRSPKKINDIERRALRKKLLYESKENKEKKVDPEFELQMAKLELVNNMTNLMEIVSQLAVTATTMEQFDESKAYIKEKFLEFMKDKNGTQPS